MIDYKHSELFLKDSIEKQMQIVTDDKSVTITNEELHLESFELQESLCSQNSLTFGSCEASQVKFKISNVFLPLIGKWITISESLQGAENEPFVFGRYKVVSDTPTADKRYRNVTAYDAMYELLKEDVSDWYNTLLPNSDSAVTLKKFRDSFFSHVGITQDEATLINDSMMVERTIDPDKISGKDVITAICEINGVLGHIGRNGHFQYIQLKKIITGLYPKDNLYPSNDLYPKDSSTTKISRSNYKSIEYEDFICKNINKLQIRQEENDIGSIYPDGELKDTDNCYVVEGNFLVYGKSAKELSDVARKLYGVVSIVSYQPFKAVALSNPCLEVGDQVRFHTNLEIIETYMLQRTIKGIQVLTDTLSAKGTKIYDSKANGVMRSIQQLKGKANILERNVEETRMEIVDVEKGLDAKIQMNADSISAEVRRATQTEGELSSSIQMNADSISAEVRRATQTEGELSSSIQMNADSISAEVRRAQGQEVNLAAAISINADNIKSKVSKGDVSSEISQEAGIIRITSDRFVLDSTNCKISEDGTITAMAIGGGAIQQFSNMIDNSEAMRTAREAISRAQNAADTANSAASTANSAANAAQSAAERAQQTADNLRTSVNNNYNSISTINGWINQISAQLRALGQPGIS